jgi:phospholipase A1
MRVMGILGLVLLGFSLRGEPAAEGTPLLSAREGAVRQRMASEREAVSNPWLFAPHRANYILPFTYTTRPNRQSLRHAGSEADLDHKEVKFQISFKLPLVDSIGSRDATLFLAYTQLTLWQAFNPELSEGFRESNYEPEIFLLQPTDWHWGIMELASLRAGIVHQSNGRGLDTSTRSWDRLYLAAQFERGNFGLDLKPWWRIPESAFDDENPNIEKYFGYGEMRAAYKRGDSVVAVLARNNFRRGDNKGAVGLDITFPLNRHIKGMLHYFNGYGETLLDYDYSDQRFGIGFLFTDWL